MSHINIFVVGDLIIDHTVFVQEHSIPPQQNEPPVYEVIRRIDTAGGATNTARILAILSSGHTFLWGITGESNWGSFRSILEKSQAIDGPGSNIEFRGVHDETHARMNTITRLFTVDNASNLNNPVYKIRFDDYGHVHISEDKKTTVLYYLTRAHEKHNLDAIIINDYDMNCLTGDMVKEIANFANHPNRQIPLFVDPKYSRDKYTDIEGTAILPNLSEWCQLVDEGGVQAVNKWKSRLDNENSLLEMAELSFHYLGNFRYHVIKCDQQGAVLIAPHSDRKKPHKYAVYRVMPHNTGNLSTPHQLGCGDLMSGVIALEFANSKLKNTDDFLKAFLKANAAVACYKNMPWQRVPSFDFVRSTQNKLMKPELMAEPSKGMLFLPKKSLTQLSEYETEIPGLFTADSIFRERIEKLIKDLKEGWDGRPKSIILGAPSGSGKSTIIGQLKKELGESMGLTVIDLSESKDAKSKKKTIKFDWSDLDSSIKELSALRKVKTNKILVVIDEALKGTMAKKLKQHGVNLLNSAQSHAIRFLFIDALFKPATQPTVDSEFTSRCHPYYLPSLADRPIDIPLIVAGYTLSQLEASIHSVKFEGQFLLTITNAALSKANPRDLCDWAEEAYKMALNEWDNKETLNVRFDHLAEEVRKLGEAKKSVEKDYEFHRA